MTVSTKEPRLPELRVPEVSRDAIARGLSEIQVPDLSTIELPSIEGPEIDLSKIDLPRVDLGKAVAGAAVAIGIARPSRRRWPFLLGAAVVVGLTAWALMHATTVRDRIDQAARMARERVDDMRATRSGMDDGAFDVAGALDTAGVGPNEGSSDVSTATAEMADDLMPAFEEAEARA